jgi:hypothetical protein
MKNIKNVFVDMDNVLYLFSIKNKEQHAVNSMWQKGYFENLPLIDEGVQEGIRYLNAKYNIYILSKCINEQNKIEKLKALQRDFDFLLPHQKILIMSYESKTEHIRAIADIENSVLIDDFKGNLNEFKLNGGKIIKKRYSNKQGYEYILKNWKDIKNLL